MTKFIKWPSNVNYINYTLKLQLHVIEKLDNIQQNKARKND